MKPIEHFFRKYFLSMVGIIILFLFLNAALFFSVLLWAKKSSDGSEISIHEVRNSILWTRQAIWYQPMC